MRIAYVTADPGVPVFGRKGCSIHVQEVVRALSALGAEVELFATNCAGEPLPELANVRLHRLPPAPKGNLGEREQKCLALNEPLRETLQTQGPFDLVYERHSLWSFAAMEYARDRATPGILEVNAPLIEEQAEHRGLIDRAGALQAAERAFKAANALVAVSSEVGDYLEGFPHARGKIHVVPNGVNPDRFPPDLKASLPAAPGTFTIGFAGSMKPWHGLGTLLEAFAQVHARHPLSRLLLVGDGAGRQPLEAEASARGFGSALQFTGAVAPREVPGLLASMNVGVAPYPELANFYFSPLKVYEYMAAGLPVVASRVGQLEDLIEPEVTGLLVPPGDVNAFVSALERIRNENGLGMRLGQAARAEVLRHHTWQGVAQRILGLAGLAP